MTLVPIIYWGKELRFASDAPKCENRFPNHD